MRIPEMEIFSGYRVGNSITRNQNFFLITDVIDMKKTGRIGLNPQVKQRPWVSMASVYAHIAKLHPVFFLLNKYSEEFMSDNSKGSYEYGTLG